ncbi:transcription intermediary factor 1-beta-like isoform X3 [Pyrgilauda ruficollis]|uniref:transcription intermediary factor 1-beta-like isoform X3 n=1 Tax=Pyrgilauda ruficollis TaxID=221976 RepID=UPI001B8729DF|nr:transcription intermediary factor 1-beta-like isoform X3 [Pyrgilauda ruficollis]
MENLFLQASTAATATSGQSCTSCEDNAAATSFCLECAEPLCDTCVEAHLRVRYTREHSVQPLAPVTPSRAASVTWARTASTRECPLRSSALISAGPASLVLISARAISHRAG